MILYGVTAENVRDALRFEKTAGRIASHVWFKIAREFTPRGGGVATEVQLEAYERDRGRRYGNGGSYGRGEDYAATYDEWGWFLQHLYDEHPDMVCGSRKHPTYADRSDYVYKTGASYTKDLAEVIERDGDPYPYVWGRNTIGRRGAGRLSYDEPRATLAYAKGAERSAEWARQFYAAEVY